MTAGLTALVMTAGAVAGLALWILATIAPALWQLRRQFAAPIVLMAACSVAAAVILHW